MIIQSQILQLIIINSQINQIITSIKLRNHRNLQIMHINQSLLIPTQMGIKVVQPFLRQVILQVIVGIQNELKRKRFR